MSGKYPARGGSAARARGLREMERDWLDEKEKKREKDAEARR